MNWKPSKAIYGCRLLKLCLERGLSQSETIEIVKPLAGKSAIEMEAIAKEIVEKMEAE